MWQHIHVLVGVELGIGHACLGEQGLSDLAVGAGGRSEEVHAVGQGGSGALTSGLRSGGLGARVGQYRGGHVVGLALLVLLRLTVVPVLDGAIQIYPPPRIFQIFGQKVI